LARAPSCGAASASASSASAPRVDVYLPLDAEVKAALGDKVYAAESVLAWLTPPDSKPK